MEKGTTWEHISDRGLAHITRFNRLQQHFPESVAEHTYFVAYTVSILCSMIKENGFEVNKEKALEMALIHDREEIRSGDILSSFKHGSEEVTQAIHAANMKMLPLVFEELPQTIAQGYMDLWVEEGEGESIEAQVVKIADTLSSLAKSTEEVQMGNKFFRGPYEVTMRILLEYDKPWWLAIKDEVMGWHSKKESRS